jgi:hypothetical protein
MQKPQRSVYTPQDFLQWRESKALVLTPKFQRRGVWKPKARSFFIDTLLREMPVPPIYIRVAQSPGSTGIVREVIDGQQRVSAILDFIDGQFRLSKSLGGSWAGSTYDKLSIAEQNRITSYSFSAEIFSGLSDLQVLEIFARLNTYSVPLNAQELRNGRFFGIFKQTAYALAHEHLEFWRANEIFTEQRIARMLEVELTSELMIAEIAGMQDKKKSIDTFYDDFDDTFPNRSSVRTRFRTIIDTISETFDNGLKETEFNRPPLFYSLFCALYHRLYRLPKTSIKTPRRRLDKSERLSLKETAQKLSEYITAARSGDDVPNRYSAFVSACLRQTDNIKPRQTRLKTVYEHAF